MSDKAIRVEPTSRIDTCFWLKFVIFASDEERERDEAEWQSSHENISNGTHLSLNVVEENMKRHHHKRLIFATQRHNS